MRRHRAGLKQRQKLPPLAGCHILGENDSVDPLVAHRLPDCLRSRHERARPGTEAQYIQHAPGRQPPGGGG